MDRSRSLYFPMQSGGGILFGGISRPAISVSGSPATPRTYSGVLNSATPIPLIAPSGVTTGAKKKRAPKKTSVKSLSKMKGGRMTAAKKKSTTTSNKSTIKGKTAKKKSPVKSKPLKKRKPKPVEFPFFD